jgi:predicted secreted protein
MSDGISGYGTTVSGASTGALGDLTGVNIAGMDVTDLDVSTMASPDRWKEFIAGMKNAGEVTLTLLYEMGNFDAVQTAFGGPNEAWTVTFPDGSTFVCSGYIKHLGADSKMDDKITQAVTIKLSGEPVFTQG